MVRLEMESSRTLERQTVQVVLHPASISQDVQHIFSMMSLTPLFEIIEHRYAYEEASAIVDLIAKVQNEAWMRLPALETVEGTGQGGQP